MAVIPLDQLSKKSAAGAARRVVPLEDVPVKAESPYPAIRRGALRGGLEGVKSALRTLLPGVTEEDIPGLESEPVTAARAAGERISERATAGMSEKPFFPEIDIPGPKPLEEALRVVSPRGTARFAAETALDPMTL